MLCDMASAQIKSIVGKITDESGQPAAFASVRIKGTKFGVEADADGNFSIKAKEGDALLISGAGLNEKEVVIDNSSSFAIRVSRKEGSLTEVVVTTALGIQRQAKDLG